MAAVTVCSDFGAPENKICHCFYFFHIYLPWSDEIGYHNFSFLNVWLTESVCWVFHRMFLKNHLYLLILCVLILILIQFFLRFLVPFIIFNYNMFLLSFFDFCWKKAKVAQLCQLFPDPMNYTIYGILQARKLEWVAVPFSMGSSQTRDRTEVSCIAGGFFTNWAIGEACNPLHWKCGVLTIGLFVKSLKIF